MELIQYDICKKLGLAIQITVRELAHVRVMPRASAEAPMGMCTDPLHVQGTHVHIK